MVIEKDFEMTHDITPRVKGLIFDLDCTLIDSMPFHYYCWKVACEKFDIPMSEKFLREYTGCPAWEIAEIMVRQNHLEDKVSADELANLKMQLFHDIQCHIKPIEPVADIVKKYYGILPMAVGTGGHKSVVKDTLEITGLSKFFDIVITANDITHFKPDPETFMLCAQKMNVDPKQIEVFEDGELGLQAARTAGMIATDVNGWYDSNWEKDIPID